MNIILEEAWYYYEELKSKMNNSEILVIFLNIIIFTF